MNDKEKRIKEARTIEATKKDYMGLGGKFGLILRTYGQPIVAHRMGGESMGGGIGIDRNYLEDPYELPEDNDPFTLRDGPAEYVQRQIPTMEVVGAEPTGGGFRGERDYDQVPMSTTNLGYYYYGLDHGLDLEIKYSGDPDNLLVVKYKGEVVYKEKRGELAAFVPFDEWESHIERLVRKAKPIDQQARLDVRQQEAAEAKQDQEGWLQQMRKRWGF